MLEGAKKTFVKHAVTKKKRYVFYHIQVVIIYASQIKCATMYIENITKYEIRCKTRIVRFFIRNRVF